MTFRWLKRIFVWSLVGLMVQLPAYYLLDQQVKHVMNPSSQPQGVLTQANTYKLDASNIINPMASYDDGFMAFRSGNQLSIYDFSKQTVIWKSDQANKVLAYHWLPDRNALMIFESGIGVNTNLPGQFGVGIHSIDATGNQGTVIDQFASPLSLSFKNSGISDISISTATNLLYFLVHGTDQTNLYEIDVMKNLKRVNKQGENVESLAVSPVKGTVYYNIKGSSSGQVLADSGKTRVQIASNPLDKVLGIWNQKVYLGTVDQGYLTKIWTISDTQPSTKLPDFALYWEGKVPWNQSSEVNSLASYGLLVRTDKTLDQVSPQGSKSLVQGENSFFSPSGKCYYTFSTDSTGTTLKRVLF